MQTKLEEELQVLQSSHSKLEVELATQKEKVHGLSQIRSQLEVGIERERTHVARIRGEMGEAEEHARAVERQLQEERREHRGEAEQLSKEAQESRCVCVCVCVCACACMRACSHEYHYYISVWLLLWLQCKLVYPS